MLERIFVFFGKFGTPALITAVVAYLIGSISFSIIITNLYLRKDIRSMGSKNAGATNVLRSVGKVPAILTFVGDFGKGVLAIVIGGFIFQEFSFYTSSPLVVMKYGAYIAGMCCFLGHLYPLYFKFVGGKGVLTAAAMMAIIDWRVFLIEMAIFGIVFGLSKIISLASIVCAALYPLITYLITFFMDHRVNPALYNWIYLIITTVVSALMAAMLLIKHFDNIKRLFKGTEKQISSKD